MDQEDAGELNETRSINLGSLLSGLLGNAGEAPDAAVLAPTGNEALGGLLSTLLGGGAPDLGEVASQAGVSESALQGIVPLILGALAGQGHGAAGAGELSGADLEDLAQGKAGAVDALAGSGLLQEVMRRTGLSKSGALGVIMAVLRALGVGKPAPSTHAKPKPKPKPSARPKPKPKPSASAASKPKPKPKPSAHESAGAKPKPKPSASASSRPKPKPKPKPRRSGEVGGSGETAAGEA